MKSIMVLPTKHKLWPKIKFSASKVKNLQAAVSLEAALTLPLVLLLLFGFLKHYLRLTERQHLKQALDMTAREMEVALPLLDLAPEKLQKIITQNQSLKKLPYWLLNSAENIGATVLLGQFVNDRCRFFFAQNNKFDYRKTADAKKISVRHNRDKNTLELIMCIENKTIWGMSRAYIQSEVPLWGRGFGALTSKASSQSDKDSIWQLPNFARGIKLREYFGANLALQHPVIAKYEAGQATMIKSIDLTAPGYATFASAKKQILSYLARLKAYCAEPGEFSAGITSKVLRLIVPENAPPYFDSLVEMLKQQAANMGIDLVVTAYGKSQKYVSVKS